MNEQYEIVRETYIDPAIKEVVLATKQFVNDVIDEAVEVGNKVYDVI